MGMHFKLVLFTAIAATTIATNGCSSDGDDNRKRPARSSENLKDRDRDGIRDGLEDRNRNGVRDGIENGGARQRRDPDMYR